MIDTILITGIVILVALPFITAVALCRAAADADREIERLRAERRDR